MKNLNRRMFITFEGGDGTGKSTLIKLVGNELQKEYDVFITREPGGSVVAEAIREIVLNNKYKGLSIYTEALLFAAARAEHLEKTIIPQLEQGKIVICDRFIDSSLAYQGYARDLGLDYVLNINKVAVENMPELTFYIDLDPTIGISRIKNREKNDRLDQEIFNFHLKSREGYLELIKKYPDRIVKLDGTKSIEELASLIVEKIKEELWNKH